MIASFARKMLVGAMSVAVCYAIGVGTVSAQTIKIKIAYANNVGEPNDKAVREGVVLETACAVHRTVGGALLCR